MKKHLDEEKSVVKAALYYLICQLLVKGISFITTPIFSRMLTKEEFGNVSNFFSWQSLLIPLVTLDLRVTINKARYDFEKEHDSFLATILLTSNVVTLIVLLVAEFNQAFFENLFSMDMMYIRIMFLYIVFQTAFDYQQIQHNIFHKYKSYVRYTIISTIASVLLAVVLVLFLENRYAGRVIGTVIPAIIVDAVIYLNILRRSGKLKFTYVKYAVRMAVPLIPSALSATILSTSDRAMITNLCGSEQTALYSVAYSVSSIAAILWTALNQSWCPWLYDKLKAGKNDEVKKYSNWFAMLYTGLIIGIMLVAPEIVYIMGGESYMDTIDVMPPVILGMVCQFFYAFYFNVEYFYGETYIISLGTGIAAIVNVVLNYIFLPQFGYIVAAYTTMVGYAIMYVYHYLIVKYKVKKAFIYDNKFLALSVLGLVGIQLIISQIYDNILLRYALLGVYLIAMILVCVKYRKIIVEYVKKLNNKPQKQ